ncbi:hypothetical protein DRW03_28260 [Corallococcus sp. H22C18031201]|nr:hypothetical protein DRW03_28260 [Corallococcus sp. H22C18031201]
MSVMPVDGPRSGEGALMEMALWMPGEKGAPRLGGADTRSTWVAKDPARLRWEAQPWKRQLRHPAEYEHPVARQALVEALVTEGHGVDAEVARFAGVLEDRFYVSIAQVVRFADGLTRRLALARTDDEVLQLAHLRRNAEELAERMIEWANAGRL